MALSSFMYKNEKFHEECEWRILCCLYKTGFLGFKDYLNPSHFKENKLFIRQSAKGLVHYLKLKIPEKAIKKVIIGPKNSSDEDEIEFLLEERNFDGVKAKKSDIPYC